MPHTLVVKLADKAMYDYTKHMDCRKILPQRVPARYELRLETSHRFHGCKKTPHGSGNTFARAYLVTPKVATALDRLIRFFVLVYTKKTLMSRNFFIFIDPPGSPTIFGGLKIYIKLRHFLCA